jgi:hypothetical protein
MGRGADVPARRCVRAPGVRATERCLAFERLVRVTEPFGCRTPEGASPRRAADTCRCKAETSGERGSGAERTLGSSWTPESGSSTGKAPSPASTSAHSHIENTAASIRPPRRSLRARRPVGSTRTGSAVAAVRPRRSVTRGSAPPTESSPLVIADKALGRPQGWPVGVRPDVLGRRSRRDIKNVDGPQSGDAYGLTHFIRRGPDRRVS